VPVPAGPGAGSGGSAPLPDPAQVPPAAVLDLRQLITRIEQDPTAGAEFSPNQASGRSPSGAGRRRSEARDRSRDRRSARSAAQDGSAEEVVRTPAELESAARSICLRLLTGSARTRADLESALTRKGIPDDVARRVLDRYTEVGLIDDGAYAHAFVRTKHRERGLGRRSLALELKRKGVAEADAEAALATINSDDERARATELIERRISAAMAAGAEAARRRLLSLLARRGYPPDLAFEVVDAAMRHHGVGDGHEEVADSGYDFGL